MKIIQAVLAGTRLPLDSAPSDAPAFVSYYFVYLFLLYNFFD